MLWLARYVVVHQGSHEKLEHSDKLIHCGGIGALIYLVSKEVVVLDYGLVAVCQVIFRSHIGSHAYRGSHTGRSHSKSSYDQILRFLDTQELCFTQFDLRENTERLLGLESYLLVTLLRWIKVLNVDLERPSGHFWLLESAASIILITLTIDLGLTHL
jgi:hypothetical protein